MSQEDFKDDDAKWLDALAGRATDLSATRREAEALRAALSGARKAPEMPANDELAAARREAQLVQRAVDEGLIERTPRRGLPRWQLPLAASVLLVVAAGVVLQIQRPVATPEVLRGDEAGIVRLTAPDPARLERDLLAELRAARIEATGYEALDVHGIDADLPLPLPAAVKQVLDAHGIPAPADGVLRIEIRRPE
ncbi:MAG: hypothetical protein WDO72_20120 [Pseudomonadota bacterium]